MDTWVKTGDEESFAAVRVLMRSEGLLVGGSSGSALSGAEKWFKSEAGQRVAQTEGLNVVLILADGSVFHLGSLNYQLTLRAVSATT